MFLMLLLAMLLGSSVSAAVAVAIVNRRRTPEDIAGESVHQRLRRMEETLEAMSAEIERQGEGQRFLTALLADPAHAGRTRQLEPGTESKPSDGSTAERGEPRAGAS